MATELIVRVAPLARLVPVTAGDQETLLGLPQDKEYAAKLTSARPRSLQQNKFYWSLLGLIVENHRFYRRADPLHLWLKTRLGYVEEIHFHDGRMFTKVSSTSFERMSSDDFKAYLDAVIAVLCEEVIPGLKQHDLVREIEHMLGFSYNSLWVERKAA